MAKKKDRPADPVERERARVLEACERLGLDLVRFLYVDHGGVVRGKATSRARLEERLATGIGLTVAMQAMSMLDELAPVDGLGPVGEVRLVPDTASFVPLPWAPGAGAMVADLVRLDGGPWQACPRAFLKRAVDELATEGFELLAAFEPELTLGRLQPGDGPGDPARLVPLDESLCFSTTGFGLAHDYAIELVRALQAQGLTVEQYYPELGHGQQELSVRHAPALRAADNQVWFRETARGVAWRQGLWASLAPKPVPDQAGNGAHLHASLWADGRNAFWDADREAAVRVPSRMWGLDEASTNLELKPSDATGNPYLALGAYIHAGLDGLRNRLDPGRPVDVDPAGLSRSSRSRRGIRRLPESLAAALDALEADELLMEALGPLRRTAYLAVKRSEAATFAAHTVAFECAQHAAKF